MPGGAHSKGNSADKHHANNPALSYDLQFSIKTSLKKLDRAQNLKGTHKTRIGRYV